MKAIGAYMKKQRTKMISPMGYPCVSHLETASLIVKKKSDNTMQRMPRNGEMETAADMSGGEPIVSCGGMGRRSVDHSPKPGGPTMTECSASAGRLHLDCLYGAVAKYKNR